MSKTSPKNTEFKAKTAKQHYEEAAARIVEALKAGTAPWIQPWSEEAAATFSRPMNANTERPYAGINTILLMSRGYKDPRWCTFNQAKANEWNVKKGEKGTAIYFFKPTQVKTEEIDPTTQKQKIKTIPVLKSFVVFNAEQLENVPAYTAQPKNFKPVDAAESILSNSGAKFSYGQHEPSYDSHTDTIKMPPKGAFKSEDLFYSCALHELGHWTGAESRLNRPQVEFVMEPELYAREEMRAEIASMLLSADTGIMHNPENHMAFIGEWIQILESDPKEIFKAARDAEAIRNHILQYLDPQLSQEVQDVSTQPKAEQAIFTQPAQTPSTPNNDDDEFFDFASIFDEVETRKSASPSMS